MDVDVAVLGAGPSGLAAAWYAARRGFKVTVLDRAPTVGGLTASITVDGQRVDLGSHRLHPSIDPPLLADLRDVLDGDLQQRPRHGRLLLDGRWLAFPLRAGDLLRNAPPRFAARAVADLVASPLRRSNGDSFAAAVRAGMGPAVAERFYGPYARKLFGVAPEELSVELFRRRVGARTAATAIRRAVRRGPRPWFWYPVGGFGRICESLACNVADRGGTVRLSTQLERVTPGAVTIAGGESITARTVVSTIQPGDLARLAGAPPAVVDAACGLTHRGAVLVYLGVPRPWYTPFDAHYFPGPEVVAARLSEPKAYRDDPSDPPDRTVLCAELPATVGDGVWSAGDGELAARLVADLVNAGLPDPDARTVHVERRTHVYPVYLRGHERLQRTVDEWVESVDGVVAVGRQALFAHDNTHHALAMGRAAAACLDRTGRVDRGAWAAARAGFATHVVED